jgi:hypothetical protein
MTTLRTRRTYDHRIREMICETGDPDLFPELKIPRSTLRSWLHRGIPDVVTSEPLSAERTHLLVAMQELRHRLAVLGAIVGLLVVMLRVSENRMDRERLPEGNGKRALLRAIERASGVVPLTVALRIARLSASRYHSWRRAEIRCELDDRSSCPRSKPTRLTAAEIRGAAHRKSGRFAVDLVSPGARLRVAKAAAPCLPSEAQGGHPRRCPERAVA